MELKLRNRERNDHFIKRFKLAIEKSGIISSLKNRMKGYKKPSLIKREKKLNKIRKIQKYLRLKNYYRKLY